MNNWLRNAINQLPSEFQSLYRNVEFILANKSIFEKNLEHLKYEGSIRKIHFQISKLLPELERVLTEKYIKHKLKIIHGSSINHHKFLYALSNNINLIADNDIFPWLDLMVRSDYAFSFTKTIFE